MTTAGTAAVSRESDFPLVANVSLLYAELPFLDRMGAAATAGFQAVEMWWPFDGPTPGQGEVDDLVEAIHSSGVPLAGLNLWAGDMPAGERGVVSLPDRRAGFEANLDVVVEIASRTGCRLFNALYGQRQTGLSPEEQDALALENLAHAALCLAEISGTVLLEPLSRGLNGAYPIETLADALPVIRRARDQSGLGNIGLLFDTFHLTNNGEDLAAAIEAAGDDIAHVQFADTPGRGEPGTGRIDFVSVLESLKEHRYAGAVAAEYVPSTLTPLTLGWVETAPHLHLEPAPLT